MDRFFLELAVFTDQRHDIAHFQSEICVIRVDRKLQLRFLDLFRIPILWQPQPIPQ